MCVTTVNLRKHTLSIELAGMVSLKTIQRDNQVHLDAILVNICLGGGREGSSSRGARNVLSKHSG